MLTQHIFEPLNVKSIPFKSNGSTLLLNIDGEWYGSLIWEHNAKDDDIYFEQDGAEYYFMKNRITHAYLVRDKAEGK